MVNFKQVGQVIEPPKLTTSEARPGEIKIEIEAEEAKKLITGYNALIKNELMKTSEILFAINSEILNLEADDPKFSDKKINISKLLVNLIASFSSLQVVYRDDNESPPNN